MWILHQQSIRFTPHHPYSSALAHSHLFYSSCGNFSLSLSHLFCLFVYYFHFFFFSFSVFLFLFLLVNIHVYTQTLTGYILILCKNRLGQRNVHSQLGSSASFSLFYGYSQWNNKLFKFLMWSIVYVKIFLFLFFVFLFFPFLFSTENEPWNPWVGPSLWNGVATV